MPEHVKEKIRKKMKGRRLSPETEFKKGMIPWNKGLKRRGLKYAYHTNSSTKFKKGYRPQNWKPVGTITIRTDNREVRVRFIKIAEPSVWIYYSRYVWEETRGRKIPPGFIVYHQDGNSLNDAPGNLICIPRSIHMKFLKMDLPDFEPKRIATTIAAQKKRWDEYRRANGIRVA